MHVVWSKGTGHCYNRVLLAESYGHMSLEHVVTDMCELTVPYGLGGLYSSDVMIMYNVHSYYYCASIFETVNNIT